MEAKTLQLVKLIGVEVGIFEQFLQSLSRQQEALVNNDLSMLNDTTQELEELTLRTRQTETERQQLVRDISAELNLHQDDLNLTELSKLLAGPEGNELVKLQQTLLELHHQIMETKSRNEFLIRKSMEYLNTTISCITGDKDKDATYPAGDRKSPKAKPLSLDRRA